MIVDLEEPNIETSVPIGRSRVDVVVVFCGLVIHCTKDDFHTVRLNYLRLRYAARNLLLT